MATLMDLTDATKELHPIVGDRVIEGEGTSLDDWSQWQQLQNLPRIDVAKHFPPSQRVCIFAPHPDDEILGCGGLIQALVAQGNQVLIVSVTNGGQSHPNSQIYPVEKLERVRILESHLALMTLGASTELENVEFLTLNLPDGEVFQRQDELFDLLKEIIKPRDILVTSFEQDGHPDHEGTGKAIKQYAQMQQLVFYQVLIWAWHWAKPADTRIAWEKALRFDLSPLQQQLKIQAMRCFTSQLYTDITTGQAPILSSMTLARLGQAFEVYLHE